MGGGNDEVEDEESVSEPASFREAALDVVGQLETALTRVHGPREQWSPDLARRFHLLTASVSRAGASSDRGAEAAGASVHRVIRRRLRGGHARS